MKTSLELLKESGALLEGHFLLSSGRHSDRYFQCARLMQYPDRAAEALRPLAQLLRAQIDSGAIAVDALIGPAMGGIVVAYELGRQLGLPAFFTERDDAGTMSLRRGFELTPGMRVLMVEDVVTTGLSTGECAAVIRGTWSHTGGARLHCRPQGSRPRTGMAGVCQLRRRGPRLGHGLVPAMHAGAGCDQAWVEKKAP